VAQGAGGETIAFTPTH